MNVGWKATLSLLNATADATEREFTLRRRESADARASADALASLRAQVDALTPLKAEVARLEAELECARAQADALRAEQSARHQPLAATPGADASDAGWLRFRVWL